MSDDRGPISVVPRSGVDIMHDIGLEVDLMVQSPRLERAFMIDSVSEPHGSPTNLFTAAAAKHLYDQECALHDAHASGVAIWILRAEQRLHTAILFYEAASLPVPPRPDVVTATR